MPSEVQMLQEDNNFTFSTLQLLFVRNVTSRWPPRSSPKRIHSACWMPRATKTGLAVDEVEVLRSSSWGRRCVAPLLSLRVSATLHAGGDPYVSCCLRGNNARIIRKRCAFTAKRILSRKSECTCELTQPFCEQIDALYLWLCRNSVADLYNPAENLIWECSTLGKNVKKKKKNSVKDVMSRGYFTRPINNWK